MHDIQTLADHLFLRKLQEAKGKKKVFDPAQKRTKMLDINVPKDSESQLQMSHTGYRRLAQFHLTRRSRKSSYFQILLTQRRRRFPPSDALKAAPRVCFHVAVRIQIPGGFLSSRSRPARLPPVLPHLCTLSSERAVFLCASPRMFRFLLPT